MSTQVWIDERNQDFRVVALTPEALYYQDMENQAAQDATSQLHDGAMPDSIFGDKATHIPLRRLTRVRIDRNDDNDVELFYREGKEKENDCLSLHDRDTRDSIFSALKQATSSRFSEFVDAYSRPRAAFASLATLTAFGILTWLLAAAAIQVQGGDPVDVSGRRQGIKRMLVWILDFLGPWGVSIVGGILCALAGMVLVSRLRTPQLMVVLQAEPYKPGSALVTAVKYAVLLGAWALVIRAILL